MTPCSPSARTVRRPKATSPLILAVENGHFELAVALLKAGADPNDQPAGYTALHAIAWVRKPIRGDGDPPPIGSGIVNSLDVRPAACGAQGGPQCAARKGRIRPEAGSPPRARRPSCWRPALRCPADAAAAGAGGRSEAPQRRQLRARWWPRPASARWATATKRRARKTRRWKRSACCLEFGADVNAVDDNGETAMHGAAYQSRCQRGAAPGRARRGHQGLEPARTSGAGRR